MGVLSPKRVHISPERAEQSPAPTIGNIICTYKSITTKLSNKNANFPGRVIWQRNYYDHIIRDEHELQRIREYIIDNPCQMAGG